MNSRTWLAAAVVVFIFLAGCDKAHMFWSPDGSLAAYARGGEHPEAYVVDQNGAVVARLGPSAGGFAWTDDSETLYFAAYREAAEAATRPVPAVEVRRNWLEPDVPQTQPATAASSPAEPIKKGAGVIGMWRGGQVTELFSIPGKFAWYAALSPNQKWLALVTSEVDEQHSGSAYQLYAYALASERLYPLCDNCALGFCFTGPSRLAYASGGSATQPQRLGQVVEVVLDEESGEEQPALARRALADVLYDNNAWMQPLGQDLLFTTRPRSLPSAPASGDKPYRLCHLSRADGQITALADDVGPVFMPSPDGQRILFEKITPKTHASEEVHELAVMNRNGSSVRALCKAKVEDTPMLPTWRGNDQIVFTALPDATTQPATNPQERPDVVLYELTAEGQLQPIRTLSAGWPADMKPTKQRH